MNDPKQHEEENLERLIREGFDPAARPTLPARQQMLQRLQAEQRAEYGAAAPANEQQQISSPAPAQEFVDEPALRRSRQLRKENESKTQEKDSIMNRLFRRWGFGVGAVAGAAAIAIIALLVTPRAGATAAEVMAKGARAVAKLGTVHLRAQMRTLPADSLSLLWPDAPLIPIELWKEYGPIRKWRVEKAGRVEVMDGQANVMLIKPNSLAFKLGLGEGASDASWLLRIANLSDTITSELNNALAKGWKLSVVNGQAAGGRPKSVVTVEARSNLPDDDFLKNKSLDLSDTRWVYHFDAQSELLESVEAYLPTKAGALLIMQIEQIEYNQPIDAAVFQLQLPTNVKWYQQELTKLPDNEKYAAMTAPQAARAFFEACGREDWAEAAKFWRAPIDDQIKQMLGGVTIISLGELFTSAADSQGASPFIPYEIKFKDGNVKKFNLHLGKDGATGRWFVAGGI
jgi:hypothetical protein